MKINEFLDKVNQNDRMYASEGTDVITICDDFFNTLMKIPKNATNLLEIHYIVNSYHFGRTSRKHLSALIEEFLHTPVKERFPEKKYRLATMRYIEGLTVIKQYVSNIVVGSDSVKFYFGSKENAGKWTDADLHYLSQWLPKEAIEAMKEEFKDDEKSN